MGGFLILVLVLGAVWLLFVIPARRKRGSHEAMQDSIELGDEIITAGGLHATVRELGDVELRVEIAPGVVATLDRRAVAAVAREIEVEVEAEPQSQPSGDTARAAAESSADPDPDLP
jgi:preprotein translocase subunit YajC